MIKVSKLTKQYQGGHTALDNVDFSIEKGHIYGLLGKNGAGKTTTMNILTGVLSATGGSVCICGHDTISEPEAAKACIGYLPEHPPLYPELTPAEYLDFVAGAKGIEKKSRAASVKRALIATDTYSVRDRLISSLSKGYRQRVGIAQAIVNDPPILILDEPTVGLDPEQVVDLRRLILSLGGEHTVILSSHILSEITEVCDRILILSEGRLVADDSLKSLIQKYPSRDVIELETTADAARAKEILRSVKGISEMSFEEERFGCHVRLVSADKRDVRDLREAVFFAFAAAHRAILSMSAKQTSLEDVFMSVTEKKPEKVGSPVKKKKSMPAENSTPIKKSDKKLRFFEKSDASDTSDRSDDDDGDDYRPLFHR